ncbi:MAG: hypothetical protein ACLTFB_01150 [Candidatus Phytoplasma pyri]
MYFKKTFSNKKIIIIIVTILLFIILAIICFLKLIPKKQNENENLLFTSNFQNKNEYQMALQNWKNNCLFRPDKNYTGWEIREKLGRKNKTLYSDTLDSIIGIYYGKILPDFDDDYCNRFYKLDYKYRDGNWKTLFIDEWKLCNKNNNYIFVGTSDDGFINVKFNGYFDTSPPPTKPIV